MMKSIKNKLLFMIYIAILMISTLSFTKKQSQILDYIRQNQYSLIRGGTEHNNINFIVAAKEKYLGDSVIIFFDKNYNIKNYLLFSSMSGYQPVFISEKYILLGVVRINDSESKGLILYDIKKNKIRFIGINYHLIWNLFISDENLFFSSEMANPHLNVINLETGEEYHCDDYYCPCAEFGIVDGEVYACYDENEFFVYRSNKFMKTDSRIIDFKPEYYELNNFKVDDNVLEKLH